MERYEEAEEHYLLSLKAEPNNVDLHSDYGNLLEEMERYEGAEKQGSSLFCVDILTKTNAV